MCSSPIKPVIVALMFIGFGGDLGIAPSSSTASAKHPVPLVTQPQGSVLSMPLVQAMGEPTFEGTLWGLARYRNSQGQWVPLAQETQATVTFEKGRISGNGSCNLFSGAFSLAGDRITIKLGPSTLKACLPSILKQEQEFLAGLAKVSSYQIHQGTLELSVETGEQWSTFTAIQPPELAETLWQLQSYNNGQDGVVSVLQGSAVTAIFDRQGGLTGSGGCNNYLANYQIEQQQLTITPPISTRKFCGQPEGILAQESQYLAVLSRVSRYEIQGDHLTFKDEQGRQLASFVANSTLKQ